MTETQKRFLTSYLGECWIDHNNPDQLIYARQVYIDKSTLRNRTFTEPKDKQDLLETIIRKNEWYSVVWDMNGELMESQSGEFAGFKNYAKSFLFALSDSNESFTIKLIQLPPIETAELICKWKGVE